MQPKNTETKTAISQKWLRIVLQNFPLVYTKFVCCNLINCMKFCYSYTGRSGINQNTV